ncbi:MAG: DMT family transporter [Candidatus Marinimicrobia bacterium]|nr:DMT family transporter [Candidatus Neomarinimicrobiota bacterium]MDD5231365.1 DMT family transporter [Candidatus Neomarinimicrobiota bacterium]
MKYFKFAIVCIIWSTTWAMIKIGIDQTPPMVGLALRFGIAALVLGGMILWKRRSILFNRASIRNYLIVGLLTMALGYFCTYWGEKFISSGLTSILWASLPIAVGVFAHFSIPSERIGKLQILAIAIALVGVTAILSDRQLIFSMSLLWGSFIVLVGVGVAAWPNVYLKMNHQSYDSLTLTAMAMAIAAVVHFVGATLLGEWSKMVWNFKNIGSAVYLGLFGSALAFYLYYDLLKTINVIKLSMITFITPIFATLLGALCLSEIVTWREVGGMFLIFAGLLLYDGPKWLGFIRKSVTVNNPDGR